YLAVAVNLGKVNHRSVSQMARTSRTAWSGLVSSRSVGGRRETALSGGEGREFWPHAAISQAIRIRASLRAAECIARGRFITRGYAIKSPLENNSAEEIGGLRLGTRDRKVLRHHLSR